MNKSSIYLLVVLSFVVGNVIAVVVPKSYFLPVAVLSGLMVGYIWYLINEQQ